MAALMREMHRGGSSMVAAESRSLSYTSYVISGEGSLRKYCLRVEVTALMSRSGSEMS